MKYQIERSFQKDFNKLKNKELAKDILSAINNVKIAPNKTSIKNLKKLTGYKNAYRIRVGNHRIGVTIENNIVTFVAFDHRKEIYRSFP